MSLLLFSRSLSPASALLTIAALAIALDVGVSAACANRVDNGASGIGATDGSGDDASALSFDRRVEHLEAIKAASASLGITNALLVAGVANEETNLVQCYDDAPWHCPGPYSPACDGPVLAGSGDGACAIRQGGLGMFQLDAGTYGQTLAMHGDTILDLEGNAAAGADFILEKVEICAMTPVFHSRDEVIAWVNAAVPGTNEFEVFMDAMASCWNGCSVSVCGPGLHARRVQQYRDATLALIDEVGADFFTVTPVDPDVDPVVDPGEDGVAIDPAVVSCGDYATAMEWGDANCEWNGNEACAGTGVATNDCDRCCEVASLPDASSLSCGDYAAAVQWSNALCEWNGNGACHGTGTATNDCDACCNGDAPMPSTLTCGDYASAMGWETANCEWNDNDACEGTGPETSDCAHCCHIR